MKNEVIHWNVCPDCKGEGKKAQKLRKKIRLNYQNEVAYFLKSDKKGEEPIRPKAPLKSCTTCYRTGLVVGQNPTKKDSETFPHVAIIGGGIGGVALAVACFHRGIPFTLFERDSNFETRAQGYGLTLQQASKAIADFGISHLQEGIISTRHMVHSPDGKVIGEWGMRKWLHSNPDKNLKRSNIHIARQALRLELLQQLKNSDSIKWNHQLVGFTENQNNSTDLIFDINGSLKKEKADLIVGADGIRSTVRNFIIGEKKTPLRYLDCIVILGICPLLVLKNKDHSLLDSATVFQTSNGNERIYMMPYTSDSIMWQLSFPMSEKEAIALSQKGKKALKEEAINRTHWHSPIPEIVAATLELQISGYPVYDRELLSSELLENAKNVTLIGDAAHPMSPFKGQGANQALLDALSLARKIYKNCNPKSNWREIGIRKTLLNDFENEMLERSSKKVLDSAEAAEFLHSDIVLHQSNQPRGSVLKNKDS